MSVELKRKEGLSFELCGTYYVWRRVNDARWHLCKNVASVRGNEIVVAGIACLPANPVLWRVVALPQTDYADFGSMKRGDLAAMMKLCEDLVLQERVERVFWLEELGEKGRGPTT